MYCTCIKAWEIKRALKALKRMRTLEDSVSRGLIIHAGNIEAVKLAICINKYLINTFFSYTKGGKQRIKRTADT